MDKWINKSPLIEKRLAEMRGVFVCKKVGDVVANKKVAIKKAEYQSKYQEWLEPDKLLLLEAWARDGLTEPQIAKNMGVSHSSLRNWKKKHISILQALKKGKEVVDIEVENALLKRALGYEYTEVTKELINGVMLTTKSVTKEVQPNPTAQIYWLKNRLRGKWVDNPSGIDKVKAEAAILEIKKKILESGLDADNEILEKLDDYLESIIAPQKGDANEPTD